VKETIGFARSNAFENIKFLHAFKNITLNFMTCAFVDYSSRDEALLQLYTYIYIYIHTLVFMLIRAFFQSKTTETQEFRKTVCSTPHNFTFIYTYIYIYMDVKLVIYIYI
jgi:hypothetical protein